MKTLLFGAFILLASMGMTSCKGNAAQKGKEVEENQTVEDGFLQGQIVTSYADKGCPVLVRVEMKGATQLRRPISLPEEFVEDGIRIKFKYRISRAPQKACEEGMPLIVSEVSRLK